MRYRINQIRLGIDEEAADFAEVIRKKLRKPDLVVSDIEIVKESVDARRKPDVKLVYTLDFSCGEKLKLDKAVKKVYGPVTVKSEEAAAKRRPPVIAGFGPCGMFAALILAEAGLRPIVIERGQAVDERIVSVNRFWNEGVLDPESNVQFGEGGAGTFSDGKLTTGIKDVRISKVMDEFVMAGADPSIKYMQKPHIGTDRLRDIVKNIRHKIESLGGRVVFDTKLTGMTFSGPEDNIGDHGNAHDRGGVGSGGRRLTAVKTLDRSGRSQTIETDSLILAIGHSARDTFRMLYDEGFPMEQKPFSIGVRIEHPQKMIDKAQYGDPAIAEKLGAADYKLNHRCENGRGVYTFCMCPGGHVIDSSSEPETAVTNGMSNSSRSAEFANSGLLVDVRREDFPSGHPLAGIEFQRRYERLAYENGRGRIPVTDYGSFRKDTEDPVRKSLPPFAADAIIEAMPYMGRKLRGFDRDDAVMKAVETRSSSPVRILRGKDHQCAAPETGVSGFSGVYPAGEGPGYAGGIMSAAVDGIKTAEYVIMDYGTDTGIFPG